ncbi:MAG: S41 family peptidase [Paenibacillaceae bacterium]
MKIRPARLKQIAIPFVISITLLLTPWGANAKEAGKYTELDETIDLLEAYHLSGVTEEELIQAAIEGIIYSLDDPYTDYYSEADLEAFTDSLNNVYYGTGIILDELNGEIYVNLVMENTSAEQMGVLEGDVILTVNGVMAKGKTLIDLEKAEIGANGASVKIRVRRGSEILTFNLTYAEVHVPLVTTRWFGDGVGYLRLHTFSDEAAAEFIAELGKLNERGLQTLIIDLRYNGGGLLSSTEMIAEQFLDNDVLMYTQDKDGKEVKVEIDGELPLMVPIVVLVNDGTASASEVLAGALQDNKLALIVGDQTYGKGVIQQIIPMHSSGGVLKITVEEYFTPNKHKVHGVGITPDIEVAGIQEQLFKALYSAGLTKLNVVIEPTTIKVNGEIFHTQVDLLKQGQATYLPLRFLAAVTDADLSWDPSTKSVILTKGTKKISYLLSSLTVKNNLSYIDVKTFQKDFPEFVWNISSDIPTIDVSI